MTVHGIIYAVSRLRGDASLLRGQLTRIVQLRPLEGSAARIYLLVRC
jgi:hypothetical protein